MEKITMLNPRNSDVSAPGAAGASQEEDEKEGARKRRLEHNSSDSLAESPKRSLTDEEGGESAGLVNQQRFAIFEACANEQSFFKKQKHNVNLL